jgi:transposase-like protein
MISSALYDESRGGSFMSQQHPFKWRHFQPEIILLCVRWYLHYALSYRNMEEMMLERGQGRWNSAPNGDVAKRQAGHQLASQAE